LGRLADITKSADIIKGMRRDHVSFGEYLSKWLVYGHTNLFAEQFESRFEEADGDVLPR